MSRHATSLYQEWRQVEDVWSVIEDDFCDAELLWLFVVVVGVDADAHFGDECVRKDEPRVHKNVGWSPISSGIILLENYIEIGVISQ